MIPKKRCSTCDQPYGACQCPPPEPPDLRKTLFPETPFPPRNISKTRQRQGTATYRGEPIPTWAFPLERNVRGYGPPESTDVRELVAYGHEAFLEQLEKIRQTIQTMQAFLSPEYELTSQKRQWLCGTLQEIEHRVFVLARLYMQAFEMLQDAAPHTDIRRGGQQGADELAPRLANIVEEPNKTLSISQINRIISKKNQ